MTQLGGLKVETRQLAGFGRDRMSDAIVVDVLPQALMDAANIPAQAFGLLPETVGYHKDWQRLLHARTPEFATLRNQLWDQGSTLMSIAAAYQHTDIEAAYDIGASRGDLDAKGGNDIMPYIKGNLPPISCRPGAAPPFPSNTHSNYHFRYPTEQSKLPTAKPLPHKEMGGGVSPGPYGWVDPKPDKTLSVEQYQTSPGLENDTLTGLVKKYSNVLFKADAVAKSVDLVPPMTGQIMKLYVSSPKVIGWRAAGCDGIANVIEDINSSFTLSYGGLRDEWWTHTPGSGTGSAGAYFDVASATQTYMSDIVKSLRYMSSQGKAIADIIKAMRNGYGAAIASKADSLNDAITAYMKAASSGVGAAGSPESGVRSAISDFINALNAGVKNQMNALKDDFDAEAKTLLPQSRYEGYRPEHAEPKPFPSKNTDRAHHHKPNNSSWKNPKDWRPHSNHPSDSDY